jgi:hypothetical protein
MATKKALHPITKESPEIYTFDELCDSIDRSVLDDFNTWRDKTGTEISVMPSEDKKDRYYLQLLKNGDFFSKITKGYSVLLDGDDSFVFPDRKPLPFSFVEVPYEKPDYGKYGLGKQFDPIIDDALKQFAQLGEEKAKLSKEHILVAVVNGLLAGGHASYKDVVSDALIVIDLIEANLKS